MNAGKTVAQRLGHVLEALTRQSGRLDTPEYGSWLLGRVEESQRRRRIRIQVILTLFIVVANLVGVAVACLVIMVAFPTPSVFTPEARWVTFVFNPIYIGAALVVGVFWATRRVIRNVRWAIEERTPTLADQRNTFFAPWRLTRVVLVLWAVGAVLITAMYGSISTGYVPKALLGISFSGIVVCASCYLLTEFALRPVAAQALEVGPPPRRLAPGLLGRIMLVWALGSGVPVLGILLAAIIFLTLRNVTPTQFAVAIGILAIFALVFGAILMWILSWLTATPIRVVRAALTRVENGDLDTNLVVFDGTELGQLQRGFNAMVHGLRERERVRDLFGRHVGREVAAAAEKQQIELGGEERHVAVLFVDVIGSTRIVANRPPIEVVDLLNRFFGVIVDEVDRHHGLLNKFEGDATLAIFGAPVALDHPEDEALAAARCIARRLRDEVPECPAGIGVSAGEVVAGNVGARERFEYTVIGDPVNEAARLSELAKNYPTRLLASATAVEAAQERERQCWAFGEEVTLRGRDRATRLACPTDVPQ
ncbi:mononucleotidyl cyclase [Mycobacterium sp. MYCO198283]|uniref:adenylate/guanylate cyclase domain-containing protein n=1 Tax=Mycobacterium sp. MYCO198283 TaxID=2883505 RepID=UPI001E59C012|nr:mononucleotidyl cyclase [Mycobacterium sp. MYCO198283]MCG5434471.1 mononucleotidyl cyclase [Mycobacterium sp. MYCO198283]